MSYRRPALTTSADRDALLARLQHPDLALSTIGNLRGYNDHALADELEAERAELEARVGASAPPLTYAYPPDLPGDAPAPADENDVQCQALCEKLVRLLNCVEVDKCEKDVWQPLFKRQTAAGKLDWLTRQEQRLRAEVERRRDNAAARRNGLRGALRPAPLPTTCPECAATPGDNPESCGACYQVAAARAQVA